MPLFVGSVFIPRFFFAYILLSRSAHVPGLWEGETVLNSFYSRSGGSNLARAVFFALRWHKAAQINNAIMNVDLNLC